MNLKVFLFLIVSTFYIDFTKAHNKIVYCYYGSWSVYRTGNGNYLIENMDPFLCTHIAYAFAGINSDATIHILDTWADLPDGLDGYGKLNRLRITNPNLKTLISIGGWNEGSTTFSQVFIFNGMDIDWEYPNQRGGVQQDVDDFTQVVKELKEAFSQEGFIISAAFGATNYTASRSYDVKSLSQYLDIMNLMIYDMHNAADAYIGLNSPLYLRSSESDYDKANLNVKACLDYWIAEGASREKIMIGIPAYGHTFTLSDPTKITPGSPSSGAGIDGPYSHEAGTLGFNEFCETIKDDWSTYYDSEQRAPYAVRGTDWIGYDNEASVAEKMHLAVDYNLGGAMIWSIDSDDFRAFCGVKYGILQTINDVFNGKQL